MPPCDSTELIEYSAQLNETVDFLDQERWLIASIERIAQIEIACLRVSISQENLKIVISKSKEREALLMRDVFPERAKEVGFIKYKLDGEFKDLMGEYIPEMIKLFSLRFLHVGPQQSNIHILENWPWDWSMELTVKFGKSTDNTYFIRSVKITPTEKYNQNTTTNSKLG